MGAVETPDGIVALGDDPVVVVVVVEVDLARRRAALPRVLG